MLACLALAPWPASAVSGVDAEDFFSDLPIVLTPSRLPQPLNEAPGAVTVIDRELIKATGYRDIPRLLRLVPGMQVGQERGNLQWVTYHGMGNDFPSWMQVLVDGRSVYSPANFDGVDWAALPVTIDEIERIEVVRGTNASAFGSNAVLGVVNIITRHSAEIGQVSAKARAGTQGVHDGTAQWAGGKAGRSIRASAAWKQDDGFEGLHDGHRVGIASFRSDFRIGNYTELTALAGVSDGSRELGYPDSLFGNNAERMARFRSGQLMLQWRHTPDPTEEWTAYYYHNQDTVSESWLAAAPALGVFGVPLNRNRDSHRDSVEVQHRRAWSGEFRTLFGGELRRDRIRAPFLYFGNPEQHADLGRLFGQFESRLMSDWILSGSGLVERYDDRHRRLSHRLFVNWKATADDTLRVGYARAWRTPFIFELNGDVQVFADGFGLLSQPYAPNPDLRPARMDNVEVGYLGNLPALRSRLDIRLFRESITDYIARESLPSVGLLGLPTARYDNIDQPVLLRGLEYQLDHRPWEDGRVLFSHTMIDRRTDDALVRKLAAPYTASLSLIQSMGPWSGTVTLLRMGPIAGGSGFVPTTSYQAPAYQTMDFRLAYQSDPTVEWSLVGTNIGKRHQEIADRSEQALHGTTPVNRTSPMLWLAVTLRPE